MQKNPFVAVDVDNHVSVHFRRCMTAVLRWSLWIFVQIFGFSQLLSHFEFLSTDQPTGQSVPSKICGGQLGPCGKSALLCMTGASGNLSHNAIRGGQKQLRPTARSRDLFLISLNPRVWCVFRVASCFARGSLCMVHPRDNVWGFYYYYVLLCRWKNTPTV